MIFRADFKVLTTIKKDWEMNGKTGTSRKTQILVESNGQYSAFTVKTNKNVPELISGDEMSGVFQLTEGFENKGFNLELLQVE